MANKPFDYRIINPLERPKSEDLNLAQAQAHYDVRLFARELFENQAGFLGFGFYPYSTSAPNAFSLSSGMMFANVGDPVENIGDIPGLNDSLVYRVQTTDERAINAASAPTTAGKKRWDLLQVRFLTKDERLTDSQATDILNPLTQVFSSPNKYKTLTFDVTGQEPEIISVGTSGIAVFSYITGSEADTWAAAVKPTVTAGYYYAIAYIKRYQGQTAIASADIEDARTLLKLPAFVGGTGQSVAGEAGAIAYSDGTKLAYAEQPRNILGPIYGRLLYSGGDGITPQWLNGASASSLLVSGGTYDAPTWLNPAADGQVLASDGTEWAALDLYRYYSSSQTGGAYSNATATYTSVPGLTLTAVALRKGNARIELRPTVNLSPDYNARLQNITSGGRRCYISIRLTLDDLIIDRIFSYELDPSTTGSIALPSFTEFIGNAGSWTIAVAAKSGNATDSVVWIQNCDLVVSQG